ncbi:hypothetical protein SADUNF_Sadunf16G0018700 [Salix dunnii]|uniref:Uncharacterized protein n=1 Tax=Salix dunnii TaxID=1413687 RepID=A0A835J7X2_9ROSI|nr:hypothetical protein SADUNF_Sadunf16G0018700 [Salix dunnii]
MISRVTQLICRVFRDQLFCYGRPKRERIVDDVLTGRTENRMMGYNELRDGKQRKSSLTYGLLLQNFVQDK